jgi:hypothetical protein
MKIREDSRAKKGEGLSNNSSTIKMIIETIFCMWMSYILIMS